MNTKEKILVTALRLFAVYGYEAVSVSRIAGELGITKGALYKHYKNKRDIFNCIFEYVCQLDVERSRKSGVPEQDYSDMPEAFSHVLPKSLGDYMKAQFHYWSEDEIACNFRKMLTLEQYKSSEMSALYQKVLVSGPLEYIERLFFAILLRLICFPPRFNCNTFMCSERVYGNFCGQKTAWSWPVSCGNARSTPPLFTLRIIPVSRWTASLSPH